MPRVISSDMQAAIWAHHQNGQCGQNISDKFSLDEIFASKRRVNKILQGIMLERQGAIKPTRRLGRLRAPSTSTIWKVKNFINRPDSWPLRAISRKLKVPFPTIRQIIKQNLGGRGERAIQAQNSSPIRQDGGSTAGRGFLPSQESHPQQMEKYRQYWWSLVLYVTCERTAWRFFMSFAEKKPEKLEENLCDKTYDSESWPSDRTLEVIFLFFFSSKKKMGTKILAHSLYDQKRVENFGIFRTKFTTVTTVSSKCMDIKFLSGRAGAIRSPNRTHTVFLRKKWRKTLQKNVKMSKIQTHAKIK